MKRIGIYACTKPFEGGAYQYTRSIVQAMKRIEEKQADYRVVVYSEDLEWKKICEEIGVAFVVLKNTLMKRGVYWFRHIFKSVVILNWISYNAHPLWISYRREQLDLMIISSPIIMIKPDKARILTPIFDLMHRYIDFPEVGGGQIGAERDKRYINICKSSDAVLVDSLLGRQQLEECYGDIVSDLKTKVHVLPYIEPDYMYCEGKEIQVFHKYVLYPAQFWQHKNHIRLIEATAYLRDKGIIINLVLTGTEKNNKKNVETLIEKFSLQSQVKILDYVTNEQLVYLYRHARALAMPTFAGPTNIPPLEALAAGCPMILSNNFSMQEQAGDAALYFNPESVSEIADCMEKIWTDDEVCKQLIIKGAAQKQKWGIEQFQSSLKEIIDKVVAKE